MYLNQYLVVRTPRRPNRFFGPSSHCRLKLRAVPEPLGRGVSHLAMTITSLAARFAVSGAATRAHIYQHGAASDAAG